MLSMIVTFLILAAIAAAWMYTHGTFPVPKRHQTLQYRRHFSQRRLSWGRLLVDVAGTLTDTRLTDQKAQTVETQENWGLAAGKVVQKGQMVGEDVNGNALPANDAACVRVLGKAAFAVDNSTPPAGQATNAYGLTGAAGQGSLQIDYGVNCWVNDTNAGAITAAMAGLPCWAKDDQTVSALESAGLPAGIICGVGDMKGGGDGQVHVLQGPHGIAMALALIAAQGDTTSVPFKARNVVTSLQAYGGTGTATLTETANGAWATQDGVSTNAVGDVVFIQGGTTNLVAAADQGPWQIQSLGSVSTKWVLVRPSWFQQGAVCPLALVIDIGGEGTLWKGTQWKSFAAPGSAVIGTNDLKFYVGRVCQQLTFAASALALTNVGFLSTATTIEVTYAGSGAIAATVGYGQSGQLTPGYIGTATAPLVAMASGQTKNGTTDASVVNIEVTNW